MGFGHPVYRTEDPRSRMLRGITERFGGPLVDFAIEVEQHVETILAELKPGRELHTNVEFYAGVVMELCGPPTGDVHRDVRGGTGGRLECEHPRTGGRLEDHPPGGAVCGARTADGGAGGCLRLRASA